MGFGPSSCQTALVVPSNSFCAATRSRPAGAVELQAHTLASAPSSQRATCPYPVENRPRRSSLIMRGESAKGMPLVRRRTTRRGQLPSTEYHGVRTTRAERVLADDARTAPTCRCGVHHRVYLHFDT